MSNYSSLKATIDANIKTNGNQEITGQIMNSILNQMVTTMGQQGYLYAGIAHPSDAAITTDAKVFFFATEAGTYTNKGGLEVVDGEIAILKYDTTWSKESLDEHPVAVADSGNDANLDVADEDGNVLARFENGHFRVKNFDSAKNNANMGIDSVDEFSEEEDYAIGAIVKYDGLLYKFISAHEAGEWDDTQVEQTNVLEGASHPVDVADSGNDADLDIADEDGNVLARFKNGHIQTKNFNSADSNNGRFAYTGRKLSFNQNYFDYEYLLTESTTSGSSKQGAASFGDYLFQFHNTNDVVSIFNLSTKTRIKEITFTPISNHHCNSANFGVERYAPTDYFPLLYVSQENISVHQCLVYRVSGVGADISMTLVQTITLPAPSSDFLYFPNILIDIDREKLIISGLGSASWSQGVDNEVRYAVFPLPKLSEGDKVLSLSDAEGGIYKYGNMPTTQGGFIFRGNIIQTFGMYNNGIVAAISLSENLILSHVELSKNGLADEPEGCFVWRNSLYVNFISGNIYKIKF